MILLRLFWSFFQVGLFSIGGGYAALPLIQEQVIAQNGWMTSAEFTDLITISQMTPGPIAINAASFVGARMAGVPGAVIATLGCIFPSCVIVMLIAFIYKKFSSLKAVDAILRGLRPAVVGMIAAAAWTMVQASFFHQTGASVYGVDLAAVALFLGAFAALRVWKPNPILVMCCTGVMGLLIYSLLGGSI